MSDAPTLVHLYPPIAVATVVTVLWAAVAYRLHKRDVAANHESFAQIMWLSSVAIVLVAYFAWRGMETPLTTPIDHFMAAIAGQSVGIILLFGIGKLRSIELSDLLRVLTIAGRLLIRAPFAVILLPIATWKRSRRDGDGVFSSVTHTFTGLVIGLMGTMLAAMAIGIPIILFLEG